MTHVMDKDMEHMMIDITIIRAHACAGGYRKKVKIKKL